MSFRMVILNLFLLTLFNLNAHELIVKVSLSPAGSFEAKNLKLRGEIKKDGAGFSSDQLWLKTQDFSTGIDLRDEHFKKHLEVEKFSKITLTNVKASGGKGTGELTVREVKRPITFTYKNLSEKKLEASFKVKAVTEFKLKEAKYLEIGVDDEVEIVATLDI